MLYDIQATFPFLLGVAIAIAWLGLRRRASLERILCDLTFFGYLIGVAKVTLFPIMTEPGFIEQMRSYNTIADGINLIPLVSLRFSDGLDEVAKQLILNVILGVPFGFSLPFLGVRSAKRVVLMGVAFALGIELTQLAIDLVYGFGYRTVDVNDALLNAAGVAIGFALFCLARIAYRHLGLNAGDVGEYLHAVLASH